MCVNNLPKVVTRKRDGRDSNPRPFESQVQRSDHYAAEQQRGICVTYRVYPDRGSRARVADDGPRPFISERRHVALYMPQRPDRGSLFLPHYLQIMVVYGQQVGGVAQW